jgi:hypothetical protein
MLHQRGAAQARFVKQRQIEITKVPRRSPWKLGTRGRQIAAVLGHCRIDANAVHAYYDDSQGFVVYAEGGATKKVHYTFQTLEQAYEAASRGFALRPYKCSTNALALPNKPLKRPPPAE